MNSLVARLRGRIVSQSSASTRPDVEPNVQTPITPTFTGDNLDRSTPTHARSPIDRRILPHVNELLDSYNTQAEPAPNEDREQGLSPPPVSRGTAVTFELSRRPSYTGGDTPSPLPVEDVRSDSPAVPPSESSSTRFTRGTLARLSRRISAADVWSTFGRQKDRHTPPVSGSLSAAGSRFTLGSVDTFAASPQSPRISTQMARSGESTGSLEHYRQPSRTSDSTGAIPVAQSNTSSRRPSYSRAFTSTIDEHMDERNSSHSEPSQQNSSQSSLSVVVTSRTPVMQDFDISYSSSPGTFGQDSPMPSSAFCGPSLTPPPPLPPFSHPELVAALASRSQPVLRELSANGAMPLLRHWSSSLNAKTFPPRRRRRKTDGSGNDENIAPFSFSTRQQGLRTSASMPRVRQLFQPEQRRSHSSTRLPSRRSSAEWAAAQATLSPTNDGIELWPAAVAREILRLSLGVDHGGSTGRSAGLGDALLSANAEPMQRVGNVPASEPRPCSPLLSPRSPSVLAEEPARGGDKQSWFPSTSQDRTSQNPAGEVEAERGMRDGDLSPVSEDVASGYSATFPRPAIRPYRKSILRAPSPLGEELEAGPSSPQQRSPKGTATPPKRPSTRRHPSRHSSEPALASVQETPPSAKRGKRKAEDLDITPPDARHRQHATFLLPVDPHRRTNSLSDPNRTPKRVRLSASPAPSPAHSRPGSSYGAGNTGSLPNRLSVPTAPPSPNIRPLSRATSTRSMQPSAVSNHLTPSVAESRRERRRSVSERSIPVGAIVTPQPPSLSRSSTYHMRDPRRPPRVQPTPWTPRFRADDEDPSPPHAWCFFIGFILFPLWWIASLLPIPRTRHVGGTDTEKAVTIDDPQVEHDARSWRFRCRIMSAISLLTYVPFIVLIAIFAPR